MMRNVSSLFIASMFALAACQGDDDAATGDDDDLAAAEEGEAAVESAESVMEVSAYVVDAASVSEASAAIEADMDVPDCVAIETDDETFFEATFTDCTGRAGLVAINGTLRGEMVAEADATVYTLSSADLVVGQTSIEGAWEVRDPIAEGEPTSLSGSVTVERNGRSATLSLDADWAATEECISYSLDAELAGSVRALSVDANDVTHCAGACNSSGDVSVSLPGGGELAWSFGETSELTIVGPLGRELSLSLTCAP
jgi:hypothetical protein